MLARRLALVLVLLGLTVGVLPAGASLMPAPTARVLGGDVSWPNCPRGMGIPSRPTLGLPMPLSNARFVIVGTTNGPAFTPNPCLRSQIAWARARHLWLSAYTVISYPTRYELTRYGGTGTLQQRLYRVGVAEARRSVSSARAAGLRSPYVWIDVETVGGHPWSTLAYRNNALLNGVLRGFRGAGVSTGIYSYASAWKRITGGRHLTSWTWVPSGGTTGTSALRRCAQPSFSGGTVMLGQWSASSRDYDVICPGAVGRIRSIFAST